MLKDEFIHLAGLIIDVFPTEAIGTYYVPPSKGKNPSGKLMSCYSNTRHLLADVGILVRDVRQRNVQNDLEIYEVQPEELNADEIIQADEWGDEEQLKEAWKLTYQLRQDLLKTNISSADYLGRYPFSKQPNGYELVSITSTLL